MVGEPIPGSDAKQYKLTWSTEKGLGASLMAFLIDNDVNVILAQSRRILKERNQPAYYVHIVECGGRTLYYNRDF